MPHALIAAIVTKAAGACLVAVAIMSWWSVLLPEDRPASRLAVAFFVTVMLGLVPVVGLAMVFGWGQVG